jgi:hypothetical protein
MIEVIRSGQRGMKDAYLKIRHPMSGHSSSAGFTISVTAPLVLPKQIPIPSIEEYIIVSTCIALALYVREGRSKEHQIRCIATGIHHSEHITLSHLFESKRNRK